MPDDGRSRAIEAAERAEPTSYYFTAADGCRTARRRDNYEAAEAAIDAALASGEVVLREDADRRIQEVERKHMERANEDTRRWEAFHEARVRELEAALRPFADLGEHCARFGITETALVNVSLLDRAHAALKGSEEVSHA